jgi:alpha,alpha-trehalase
LNSLLYKTEKDLERINQILGRNKDAAAWSKRAAERKELINRYLWDAQRGLFMDFNFKTHAKSTYDYVTTYYPLWAGLATSEQAKELAANLKIFEQPGGLDMSPYDTGGQWDYPYGWAPTQLLAIEGLRRYGFDADANRVSFKFLSTVAENFRKQGIIVEKYNVVNRSTEANVSVGYKQNVIGFGWTNAAFLALLHALPSDMVDRLGREQEQAASDQQARSAAAR